MQKRLKFESEQKIKGNAIVLNYNMVGIASYDQ